MTPVSAPSSAPLDLLSPLPASKTFRERSFRFTAGNQLAIAFMLNILSLSVPIMMLQVYDRIIPHQSFATLKVLLVGVLAALVLDAVLRIMRSWLAGWAAASSEYAASNAALDHFTRADLLAFEKISMGEHMQNLSAISRLREFYSGQSLVALVDLPFAALFLGLVAYIGGTLVIAPLCLLVLFSVCAILSGKKLTRALERRRLHDDRKSSTIISILSGIHSVKALGIESSLLRLFERDQNDVTKDSYKVAISSGTASMLSAGFGQASLIVTATLGCIYVINGNLSVGGLSACILLAGRAIQPVQRALGTWLRLQDLKIARKQTQSLFAIPAQPASDRSVPAGNGSGVFMDRVSLIYPGAAKPLFSQLSFVAEEGTVTAISGEKSSGKSTLLHMMAGILKPDQGTLMVEGLSPFDHSMASFPDRIGYLPQEGTIFKGSILDNLTGFRRDEASIDKARETGSELGIDRVVDLLPYGYQTLLTDSASDPIPPGVKQRICLVRILMHQPSLLLFDDADRALDKEGYNLLFRMMGRLKGSCTLIMVSHDQNLLSFADHHYRLQDGMLLPDAASHAPNISFLSQDVKGRPYHG